MGRKRGRGEGTIYPYRDGWAAQVTLGYDHHTRRQTRKTFYGGTQKEVREKLRAWREGRPSVATEGGTVAEAVSLWLSVQAGRVDGKSVEVYTAQLRPVVELLGAVPVAEVTPAAVQRMLARMAARSDSPGRQKDALARTRAVFKHQFALGVVASNPCDGVSPPRRDRADVRPLTTEQVRSLVAVSQSLRWEALIRLAVDSGMRQGELLALGWEDVTLRPDGGEVFVRWSMQIVGGVLRRKAVKTKHSRRRVPITASTSAILTEWRSVATRQQAVFPNVSRPGTHEVDGGFMSPNNFKFHWRSLKRRAGLRARFHDLRHTCASLLLLANVHPKVVQERLGHSSIAITLDTYSHLLPTSQEVAVSALEAALGFASPGEESRRRERESLGRLIEAAGGEG